MPFGFARLFLFAVLASLLAGATAARSSDFFAGYQAYLRGDYETARDAWMPLAETGDIDAQFNLGVLHENGLGIPADPAQAAYWYGEAAARNLRQARFALVRMQRAGTGADQAELVEDPIAVLESLARDGMTEAQYELAVSYDRGIDVTPNRATAAVWYERAAEGGHVAAQYSIGTLYDEGLGTAQDRERAHRWYLRAARAGHAQAMNNLGYLYERGLSGPPDRTMAVVWYRRAAEAGLAVAQNNLAACYYLGHGVARDYERAAHWYRAAAEQGDTAGQNGLALLLANGLGVERNLVRAAAWFSVAAGAGGHDGHEAAAYRERIEPHLSPQERVAAETLGGRIAARIAAHRAPPASPAAEETPRPADGFDDLAVQIQRLLKALGYYHGTVDGIVGPLTLDSIRSALRENDLRIEVEISAELSDALEEIRLKRSYVNAGSD